MVKVKLVILSALVVAITALFTYSETMAVDCSGGLNTCWDFNLGFRIEFIGTEQVGNVIRVRYRVTKTKKTNFNFLWIALPVGTSLTPVVLRPDDPATNENAALTPCLGDPTGSSNFAGAGDCEHSWWRFNPDPSGISPIIVAANAPISFRSVMVYIRVGSSESEFGSIKGIAAPAPIGALSSAECKQLSPNTSMQITRDPTNFCAIPTSVQFFPNSDCSGTGSFGTVTTPSNLVYCTSGGGNQLCNECIQVTHASPDCVDYVSGGFLITFCF